MGHLIYSAIASLDGFVEDRNGHFDWSTPDEEVHTFINGMERRAGTYLYGRRMYEVMRYWETAHTLPGQPRYARDYTEIWQAADKIVFSRTLETVSTANTRLERTFDPEGIRRLKAAVEHDVTVGGADLAGQALRAGLVDEIHLLAVPVVVGGGKSWLPEGEHLDLVLLDIRRFANGVVFLSYRPSA
jgi:dihydrofolate reductase